ncbi:PREDICTED: sialic acid-binding Ig-like lectin 7, partial [Cyprinodon variegatus]|uniref:sialic acid-binding Ig-like lectin 7 n=1 Tax=Cyprinodon variegatus TaxID=28743 RepID=UPI000742B177
IKDYQILMAALFKNMIDIIAVSMVLSVFALPGIYADKFNGHKAIVFISTPKPVEALSGSCLHVPCSFRAEQGKYEFNSAQNTTGAWIESDKGIFNINHGVNSDQIKITGDLSRKNCTTLFSDIKRSQAGEYYLRIENGNYKATACSQALQIQVKDSPWRPSINIPVGDLKEHQSVTISCSAVTPCPHSPPELTWNLQQDSERQTEKNTDGTFTTKIQETITLSDTHDGYNISCSARYPVNGGSKTAETEVTLSVSYAPKDTSASISPSGLVSAGSWVELNCSSRAKPPASFSWFRNSTDGAINVSVGQVYSFTVTEEGEYYCEATNDLGTQRSSVTIPSFKGRANWIIILPVFFVFVLICLMISIWWFRFKHPTPQQTQRDNCSTSIYNTASQTGVEVQMATNNQEEELHYGEVNFQQRRPETSFSLVRESGDQETEYTQVKVGKPEDIYAQVKKK